MAAARPIDIALRIRAALEGAGDIDDMRRRLDALIEELRQGEDQADDTRRSFGGLTSGLGNLGDALQTLAGLAVVQQFVQINRQAEALKNTLTALTGSSEQANQEIEYLNATANRLGVAVNDISGAYINLTTSAKGTQLEGQKTREIFEAVIGAMATMGKSGQEADRALTAIAQTMGKGVIQAEELTGQLEEALPGASRALAAALGVTVAELRQMVETGTVVSADVLPALAAELKKTYVGGAQQADTLNGKLAQLQNTLSAMAVEIGKGGGVEVLKDGLSGAALGATILYGSLKMLGTFMGTFAAAVASGDFSDFNRTMEEAQLKTRGMIAEVAKFTDAKDAFALTKEEAQKLGVATGKLAGETQKAGQAAEQTGGSLAKLQSNYQQLQETLEKTLSLLDKQAAAQKGWADVLRAEAELRGDITRQTQLAIAVAEQDAATKQKQATETARAASEAQHYADALAQQANVIPQVLEAAEKDAIAKQKEADAAAVAAAAASQQAEAIRAANGVILEALGKQTESAEAARDKAAQLRAEYEAMKEAGAPLEALALKMNEVVKAEDAARVAARGYREEQAITIRQLEQLKAKLDGSLGSQVAYNTAIEKFVRQQQTAADQTERRNRLMADARQADIAATRAAAELAEARGQEGEASRLRLVALEQELSLSRDQAAMRRQEVAALQELLAAKERQADTDKIRTQAEQEAIQATKDLVTEKKNEVAATESAIKAKEAEIESARRSTSAKKDEAEEQRKAAEAAKAQADALAEADREARRTAATMGYLAQNFGALSEKGKAALDAIQGDALSKAALDANGLTRSLISLTQTLDQAAGAEIRFAEQVSGLEQAAAGVGPAAELARAQLLDMARAGTAGIEGITQAGEGAVSKLEDIKRSTLDAEEALTGLADDFRKQILQIQGDQKALLELEYQDNIKRLEELNAKAGELGQEEFLNAKARAEELHRLKLQQLKEQEAAKNTAGGREETSATTRTGTTATAPTGGGVKSGGGTTIILNANNARVLDKGFVEDLTRQLKPELDRLGRLSA